MRHSALVCLIGALALALFTNAARAQACPSPNINDALSDPVVDAAMDTAWTNSVEGTASEHEEGFWIYQCRMATPTGFTYTTEVDIGVGTVSSLQLPALRTDPSCRLIGDFHTHPGVALNNPQSNDPYHNEVASPQDLASGVPGIITYGLGTTRGGGNTTDITYGPSVNPSLAWTCPTPPPLPLSPVSYNDPHLITLDGLGYDFQAVGEFVLVQSDLGGLVVQSRQQPTGGAGSQVSMNTGLAFLVGESEIAVQFDSSANLLVFVDDVQSVQPGEQALPSGGSLQVDGGSIGLTWPDGSLATIRVRSGFLNLSMALAPRHSNAVAGLLGNFDSEAANDLQTAEGVTLSVSPAADDLYGFYADSWRITDESSLFVYFDEEDTETFTDRLFPGRIVTVDDLSAQSRAAATTVCENQGIVDGFLLDNCVLDVGISGDVEFAMASAELQDEILVEPIVVEVQGQVTVPDFVCTDPSLIDESGVSVPDLAGRYTGTLTNPDAGIDWDAVFELRQCGVEFTGLLQITSQLSNSTEQYRRFAGRWAAGQLEIQLAFPYSFTSTSTLNPCRNMAASLDAVSSSLRGLWTADNCPRGGEFDVVRD